MIIIIFLKYLLCLNSLDAKSGSSSSASWVDRPIPKVGLPSLDGKMTRNQQQAQKKKRHDTIIWCKKKKKKMLITPFVMERAKGLRAAEARREK